MIRYQNRHSGEVLEIKPKQTYASECEDWHFYPVGSDLSVGNIMFSIENEINKKNIYGNDEYIFNREVVETKIKEKVILICQIYSSGQSFQVKSQNPYQGLGRLMMYLACQYAQERGIRYIKLDSVKDAAPFYRRMGMHHRDTQFVDFLPIMSGTVGHTGRISSQWLTEFNEHYRYCRSHDHMFSEINTVLQYISGETLRQWIIMR